MLLMVSTHKTAVRTTRYDRERLSTLVNSIADGFLALDKDLKVDRYNGAALNILDVNGSIEGRSITRLISLVDSNNQPVSVAELIRGIKTTLDTRDYAILYKDGSKAALYLSVAPVHSGYSRSVGHGYVLLLRDITREKSLEDEKDEFISVVSHELRTPITIAEGSISNAIVSAQQRNQADMVAKALDVAHQQVLFLAALINDLSTLSRAERGKLTVEPESINVATMLTGLANSYKEQADKKDLYIKTDLDPKLEVLQSSKLYVEEILQNFITNSIKYTEKGGITVSAKPSHEGVIIIVEDTGIGISKTDQEKIFDKFFRSEDYRTRNNNGTGLGLYVTMKLARLLHADIKVDSELNHGSTFTITFPNIRN